jgi:AcrR family transcriptional regulator
MLDRRQLTAVLEPSAPARVDDPRREILDALIRTIALRGYDRTTIERVLTLADVPGPTFEEHFANKQDCLLAALEDLVARIERAISAQIEGPVPWSERVRIGLRTLLYVLACNPEGARVALVESLSAGEPAGARMRSAVARLVPILEEGRSTHADEPGASDTDHLPPQTSEAVVGGIASILHRRVLEGRTAELPALLPDLLYFVLMPYLGHDRALAAVEADAGV